MYSGGTEVCFVFPKGLRSSQPGGRGWGGGGGFILAEKVSSVGVAPQIIGWKVCFVGYRSIRREKQIKGFI